MGRLARNVARRVGTPIPSKHARITTHATRSPSGIFFFVGPLLLVFSMVFEWVAGNFFSMLVMGLFAVFWLSFGMMQLPTLELALPYATEADPTGMSSPEYNSVLAIYLIVWGFALLTFFFFTLKINAIFAMIFGVVTAGAWILAAAYWKVAKGDFVTAGHLQKVFFPCHPFFSQVHKTDFFHHLRLAARCSSLWLYWAGTCASSSWQQRCASPLISPSGT